MPCDLLVALPCSVGSLQHLVCLHTPPLGLTWCLQSMLVTMRKLPLGYLLLESAPTARVAEMRCSSVSIIAGFHLLCVEQPIWRGWI